MVAQALPVLILMLAMEVPRKRWDADRDPCHPLWTGIAARQIELVR